MSDLAREELRKRIREQRRGISESGRQTAARGIAAQLDHYLDHLAAPLLPGTLVCSFRSCAPLGEIPTQAIDVALRKRGLQVAYPRISQDTQTALDFRIAPAWEDTQGWEEGPFGITEPSSKCPVAELRDIALILVPGLAFDLASGARIGYGKGHYDRWLAHFDAIRQQAVPVPRLGLGYEFQVVSGLQPQSWDKSMNGVITPTRWIRCSS